MKNWPFEFLIPELLVITVATSETDGFKRYMRSAKLHNLNGKVTMSFNIVFVLLLFSRRAALVVPRHDPTTWYQNKTDFPRFFQVRFLLEAGADQEHKTDEMHTALMEASMDGHVEVARLLLDSGAQVNMPADR